MAEFKLHPGLPTCRGFVFDYDGTLAPGLDLRGLKRRVIALAKTHGVPEAPLRGRYILEGVTWAAEFLADSGDPRRAERYETEAHAFIRGVETTAAERTGVFDYVPGLLRLLAGHGIQVGIVTRNCRSAVLASFPAIESHCAALVTRDDVAHVKPDPRHVGAALQAMAVRAQDAIMVGDTEIDLVAGERLSMFRIGVLTGAGSRSDLASADLVLASVAELLR